MNLEKPGVRCGEYGVGEVFQWLGSYVFEGSRTIVTYQAETSTCPH